MACQWIADCQLGPSFLGYMAEEGSAIVFIVVCINDCHHAKVEDFAPYQLTLSKLHKLGIEHGDINKHNECPHSRQGSSSPHLF